MLSLQSRPSRPLRISHVSGRELRLSFSQRLKEIRDGFEPAFWVANISEIFERLAYYGAFSSLANYLHESLNIPVEQTGSLAGLFGGMVWFLAILGGAVADRLGFRRALSLAYLILACAYFLLGSLGAAWMAPVRSAVPLLGLVAFVLVLPALGISMVKPSVVGTTARASRENVRSIGYSIYYTLVNIGGAAGPYLASWAHRRLGVENVFRVSALSVLLMFFAVLLFFKEPRQIRRNSSGQPGGNGAKFIHRNDESALHAFPADFFRLLDRVLAAIHRAADLHSRVHRSACGRGTDSDHRRRNRHLPAISRHLPDAENSRLPGHHDRDIDLRARLADRRVASRRVGRGAVDFRGGARRDHAFAALLRIRFAPGSRRASKERTWASRSCPSESDRSSEDGSAAG